MRAIGKYPWRWVGRLRPRVRRADSGEVVLEALNSRGNWITKNVFTEAEATAVADALGPSTACMTSRTLRTSERLTTSG